MDRTWQNVAGVERGGSKVEINSIWFKIKPMCVVRRDFDNIARSYFKLHDLADDLAVLIHESCFYDSAPLQKVEYPSFFSMVMLTKRLRSIVNMNTLQRRICEIELTKISPCVARD